MEFGLNPSFWISSVFGSRINRFHLAMATPFRRPWVSWRVVSSIGELRGCKNSGTRKHAGQAIAPIPRSSGDSPVEIQRGPILPLLRSISLYLRILPVVRLLSAGQYLLPLKGIIGGTLRQPPSMPIDRYEGRTKAGSQVNITRNQIDSGVRGTWHILAPEHPSTRHGGQIKLVSN